MPAPTDVMSFVPAFIDGDFSFLQKVTEAESFSTAPQLLAGIVYRTREQIWKTGQV